MINRTIVCLIAVTLAMLPTASLGAQNSTNGLHAVVTTGQLAPGTNGLRFVTVGLPSISNNGAVAFRADLTPSDKPYGNIPGKLVPNGIFLATNNSVERVIGYGDAVPSEPAVFTNFGHPVINDYGQIAFMARVGSGYENTGVYLQTGKSLVAIARSGQPAPGSTGNIFGMLGMRNVVLNNAGVVAFDAQTKGGPSGSGLFLYASGMVQAVVLSGQPVPGSPGLIFGGIQSIAINKVGALAFVAGTLNARNELGSGVFIAQGGAINTIALEGQSFGAVILNRLSDVTINDAGDVTFLDSFQRYVRGPISVPYGVYVVPANGKFSAVGRTNIPTAVTDPILGGSFSAARIGSSTDGSPAVLFFAKNKSTRTQTLWHYSHNSLQSVLAEGDQSPIGGTYSFIANLNVASSGYLAFVSNVRGASSGAAIFVNKINF